jgi:hypothetical protein
MGVKHIVPDSEWDEKMGCGYKLLIIIFVIAMIVITWAIINELTN